MPNQKRARQRAARQRKLEAQRRQQRRQSMTKRVVIVAVVAAMIVGLVAALSGAFNGTTHTTTTTTTTTTVPGDKDQAAQDAANAAALAAGCPTSTTTRVNTLHWKSAPKMEIQTNVLYYAHFRTTAGDFVVELEPKLAPITVNNFIFLADHDFYNCVIFQRVIPGFVIQGGDPTGTGAGGPGYTIPDEYPKAGNPTYPKFSVAMANESSPHTGGSQFFIVTGKAGEALPPNYTLFGKVISGTTTVAAIQNYGNPNPNANGVPPLVTERMLTVTISTHP